MKILHLDIETSPNVAHVWGLFRQTVSIKQLLDSSYTMCWSAKWHGRRGVLCSSLRKDTEEQMIAKVWHLLDEADAVVHYNGTKFDIPTLNKEFLKHGMPPPSPYKQIDLLLVARKTFRFPSNKLDYVAKALGVGSKVKNIGHDLWIGCMAGDDKAWKKMEGYNKQDVVLLEAVYNKMLPWIKSHPNHALYMDTERPVCTNCGSEKVIKKGITHTLTQSYQRYRCTVCLTPLRSRSTCIPKEKRTHILTQEKD